MQLACFRHLQDLKRIENNQADFPYYYDLDKCNKILKFASICPDVDTGAPIKLMPWQKFILTQLMGWRDNDGLKRYTTAIVSVARGQGKTYFASIISAYSYLIETIGLGNQDFLVTAPTYKQSGKLFGYIKTMLKKVVQKQPFKTLARDYGLKLQKDEIKEDTRNNVMRLISYESNQYDSYHFKTAIFDEIGDIDDRANTSKITSGQVKVTNHQYIQISTAYPNPLAPLHEDEKIYQQIMEKDYERRGDASKQSLGSMTWMMLSKLHQILWNHLG